MKNALPKDKKSVSSSQIFEYYSNQALIAQNKIHGQQRILKEKIAAVTKGKNILISNCGKI